MSSVDLDFRSHDQGRGNLRVPQNADSPSNTRVWPGNDIAQRQNAGSNLRLLAAQRYLYSSAKRLFSLHFALAIGLLLLSALAIGQPAARPWAGWCGLFVLLLDALYLQRRQKDWREQAAKIQEEFDCDVLGLPWNEVKLRSKVALERVAEQAAKYERKPDKDHLLTNWYTAPVASLPLHLARLVCQRTNCSWEAAQRRRYGQWMGGVLFAISLALVALGVAADLSVATLLTAVVLPVAPAIKQAYQQWHDNLEAADSLDRLREKLEQFWQQGLTHLDSQRLTEQARAIQDEIYEGRRSRVPVMDWVYRKLKREQDANTGVAATAMVEQAEAALGRAVDQAATSHLR